MDVLLEALLAVLKLIVTILVFIATILVLLVVPVALIFATPFVLLWPKPNDGNSWAKSVRARYARVARFAWSAASFLSIFALAADTDVDPLIKK